MACYKNCDIIMCFPGVGRTFFTASETSFLARNDNRPFREETKQLPHSTFTLDKDFSGDDVAKFVNELFVIKVKREYRYILIPMRFDIAKELHDSDIAFIIVKPFELDRDVWMKRWLKAGESAASIDARRVALNDSESSYSAYAPIVHLSADDWLGNVLDQSPERVYVEV